MTKGTFQSEADELASALVETLRIVQMVVLRRVPGTDKTVLVETAERLGIAIEKCMAAIVIGHGLEPIDEEVPEFMVHSAVTVITDSDERERFQIQSVIIRAQNEDEAESKFHEAHPSNLTRKYEITGTERMKK